MRATPIAVALLAAAVALLSAAPAQARGPSVGQALHQLVTSGQVDATAGDRYRATYLEARRTLKRLHGVRRAQLDGVLDDVTDLAAARRLSATRLPGVFLTVARNRAWWAGGPIPAPGYRRTFAGSGIVWQYYPGQGLQIQWLATFGKANAMWKAGTYDPQLRALLDEAVRLATRRAGGLAFEYLFPFGGGRPPWVSGLAQGTALSALSRAAVRLHDPALFTAAREALGIFRTPPPQGVRVATQAGAHYLQYSYAPRLRIANGFTQALNGLHDFAVLANDDEGRRLFDQGEAELRHELPSFDTGAWSLYSRDGATGVESDLGYHELLRDFLTGLCDRLSADRQRLGAQQASAAAPVAQTGGTPAGGTADGTPAGTPDPAVPDPALYCDTAQRFTTDLTTPPTLALTPVTLRAKHAGSVRFTLSKVSVVTVTVLRDGRAVLTRAMRLGRGRRAVGVRPARAGPLEVRIHAVDLAGNAADVRGVVAVRPARTPARH